MGELARGQGELSSAHTQQEMDRGDYSESNYDEFSGYGERLFAAGLYEEDDAEADQIYAQIDDQMEGRRKRSREKQLLEHQKKAKFERPRIADQFADLKRELGTVSMSEWDSIPEVGDHSLKLKQSRKKETFMPVPDFILEGTGTALHSSNGAGLVAAVNGLETPSGMRSALVGLGQGSLDGMRTTVGGNLAESRGTALSSKLDKMSDSVTGQTVVDPKGYLTNLNSLKLNSEAEVGDIKKARVLLSSVTTTNPKHGPGWIAAARVEEFAGKMGQARKIILQGCETCPESEDVWLEAARLHPKATAKSILANAVVHIRTSVKVWLAAADLEDQEANKKAVLRRSLEFVPNSVKLWKAAIELENITDARIMLARAVECVPQSVEMWLALAKLETHENARKVLNQAREAIPTERATWITAAKLEEAHGNGHLVGRIIEKMLVSLSQYQVIIDREHWLKEAQDAEWAGALLTCKFLIRNTIGLGIDEEDRLRTWMDDADSCLTLVNSAPAVHTARAIYDYSIEAFPTKKSLWLAACMLEKEHGTKEALLEKLKEGVKNCPHAEVLWLMAAKEHWLAGDVPVARAVLIEAFEANSTSEQIWLAAVKLEWENGEYVRARLLLSKARDRAPSERIWMKSALLERELAMINLREGRLLEQPNCEMALLDEAIRLYPTFAKFYMMAGQTSDSLLKDVNKARQYYQQGLKHCPTSIPLWGLLIRLEEKVKGAVKARSTCALARLKVPKNDSIWLECIRLERRTGNMKLAENLMAKALNECPKSSVLWTEELLTCSKPQQRGKSLDALKRCPNDALVIVAVARLFEKDGRIAKARRWFERATAIAPRLGDAWVYWYALEYTLLIRKRPGALQPSNRATSSQVEVADGNEGSQEAVATDFQFEVEGEDDDDEFDEIVPTKGVPYSNSTTSIESKDDRDVVGTTATVTFSEIQVLQEIERRCRMAQPNTGEMWTSVSKETAWRRSDYATILRECVRRVLQLESPIELSFS